MTALHIHFCTYMFIFYTATFYLTWFLIILLCRLSNFFYFFLSWPMHRNFVLQGNVWTTIKECETWSHWNLKHKSQSALHCRLAFKSKTSALGGITSRVERRETLPRRAGFVQGEREKNKTSEAVKAADAPMRARKKKNPVAWRTRGLTKTKRLCFREGPFLTVAPRTKCGPERSRPPFNLFSMITFYHTEPLNRRRVT